MGSNDPSWEDVIRFTNFVGEIDLSRHSEIPEIVNAHLEFLSALKAIKCAQARADRLLELLRPIGVDGFLIGQMPVFMNVPSPTLFVKQYWFISRYIPEWQEFYDKNVFAPHDITVRFVMKSQSSLEFRQWWTFKELLRISGTDNQKYVWRSGTEIGKVRNGAIITLNLTEHLRGGAGISFGQDSKKQDSEIIANIERHKARLTGAITAFFAASGKAMIADNTLGVEFSQEQRTKLLIGSLTGFNRKAIGSLYGADCGYRATDPSGSLRSTKRKIREQIGAEDFGQVAAIDFQLGRYPRFAHERSIWIDKLLDPVPMKMPEPELMSIPID